MSTDTDDAASDYLIAPEVGRGPGVLVLHSGRGLTEFTRSLCGTFARNGFVAMAPDCFDGTTPTTMAEAEAAKAAVDEGTLLADLANAAAYLRSQDAVSRHTVGVVGLGYGAELACPLAARLGEDCGALVLFYGHREVEWSTVTAPVLGHFAQLDPELPESAVDDVRETLAANDVAHDLFVYPNVEPSFLETDSTARHDPDAAELALERTVQFLRNAIQ